MRKILKYQIECEKCSIKIDKGFSVRGVINVFNHNDKYNEETEDYSVTKPIPYKDENFQDIEKIFYCFECLVNVLKTTIVNKNLNNNINIS